MEEGDKFKFTIEDSKIIYKVLIGIGIMALIVSLLLIAGEILGAKKNCNSLNGTYSLKIYPTQHLCNNQNFSKYSIGGWDFDSNKNYEINLNEKSENRSNNSEIIINKFKQGGSR